MDNGFAGMFGVAQEAKPLKQPLATQAIWLPPLRSAVFAIQPSPSASRPATEESRTFLPSGASSARTPEERRKILAKGPLHFGKGFLGCRDGAMTERSSRRLRSSQGMRGSPRCPGALGWLYREPENDARRQENWMQTCPAPECDLRQELRRPVTQSPRRVLVERSEHLLACMTQVSRYQPENASILDVARRRYLRLKELEELQQEGTSNQLYEDRTSDQEGAVEQRCIRIDALKEKAWTALENALLSDSNSVEVETEACSEIDTLKEKAWGALENALLSDSNSAEVETESCGEIDELKEKAWAALENALLSDSTDV